MVKLRRVYPTDNDEYLDITVSYSSNTNVLVVVINGKRDMYCGMLGIDNNYIKTCTTVYEFDVEGTIIDLEKDSLVVAINTDMDVYGVLNNNDILVDFGYNDADPEVEDIALFTNVPKRVGVM